MLTRLDLNSDMGERDSAEGLALDAELMPLITSVSIACGGHAGSPDLMRRTAQLAAQHGVAIGAHPGLRDRESFGRTERPLPPHDIEQLVLEQIQALAAALAPERLKLSHVKPHGALYNMAARDSAVAKAIVSGVQKFDQTLLLYALAGSVLACAGQEAGLLVVLEAFADRAYRADGNLVPRTEPGAVLKHEEAVRRQLRQIVKGSLTSIEGRSIQIRADSLCLHSDTPESVALARMVRQEIENAGIHVAAPPHARF